MKRQHDLRRGVARRRRTFFAAALPVAIPLILAAVAIEPAQNASPRTMQMSMLPLRYADLAPQARGSSAALHRPDRSKKTTRSTRSSSPADCRGATASLLTNEFGHSIDVRRLRPGNMVRFHFAGPEQIDAVQLRINGWGSVDAVRNADGTFTVTPRPSKQLSITTTISAEIDSSLVRVIARRRRAAAARAAARRRVPVGHRLLLAAEGRFVQRRRREEVRRGRFDRLRSGARGPVHSRRHDVRGVPPRVARRTRRLLRAQRHTAPQTVPESPAEVHAHHLGISRIAVSIPCSTISARITASTTARRSERR